MSWVDGLGFCASFAVLASFCMTTIVSLRLMALTSNVLFGAYGLLAHIYPVVFLHLLLLPINLVKLYCLNGINVRPRWRHHSRRNPQRDQADQVLRP